VKTDCSDHPWQAVLGIRGNWRVTFAFSGKDIVDVDYED